MPVDTAVLDEPTSPIWGKTVYLGGPMRGVPEFNFPLFHLVASWLRETHDATVFNPAAWDEAEGFDRRGKTGLEELDPGLVARWMRRDLRMLLDADAVVLLPGWRRSFGSLLESYVAEACGIPIFEVFISSAITLVEVQSSLLGCDDDGR